MRMAMHMCMHMCAACAQHAMNSVRFPLQVTHFPEVREYLFGNVETSENLKLSLLGTSAGSIL
jgi:hypothetical protein